MAFKIKDGLTIGTVAVFNSSGVLQVVAPTATKLAATKNINGIAFDGSADITIDAGQSNKATNLAGGNATTLLGSIPYQSNTDVTTMLSPNVTTTNKFLTQSGNNTNGAAPAWLALANADIPTTLTSKTYNGITPTALTTGFSLAGGTTSKTLTMSNTLTFTGTDTSSVAFGVGGTVAYTGDKLSIHAATTSAELAGIISDEVGYNTNAKLVFNLSPSFLTSIDGDATFGAFATPTTLTIGYTGTSSSTLNIDTGVTSTGQTKTINIGTLGASGSTTNINIGSTTGSGTITCNNALIVTGDLTVNGTTTTINSTTYTVDDINIILGSIGSPTNITANGGGITLKGDTDKTFNWVSATTAWTSSENLDLTTGKVFSIATATVLSATTLGSAVVNSSLTKVGALSAGTAGFVKVDASGNLTSSASVYPLASDVTYIGTTSVALNRTTAALALTGITSVTGSTTLDLASTTTSAISLDSGTTGAINIGTNANGKTITIGNATANTAIAITSAGTGATTITGSVKLPTVGTSGFVKLGAGGVLSADATTYLTAEADTLASVTGRGATTTTTLATTNATDATTLSAAALLVSGGAAITKNLLVGLGVLNAKSDGTIIAATQALQPAAVATVSLTVIDTFVKATYRSAKYLIQITQGSAYQCSEIMIIHDGTSTFMTEYGVVEAPAGALGTFTSAINTTNVELKVTMATATSATINILRTVLIA